VLNKLLIFLLPLVFLSCATPQEEVFSDIDWNQKVREFNENQNFHQAIQSYHYLQSQTEIMDADLYSRALEGLKQRALQDITPQNRDQVYRSLLSLRNIGVWDQEMEARLFQIELEEAQDWLKNGVRADVIYSLGTFLEEWRDRYPQETLSMVQKFQELQDQNRSPAQTPGELLSGVVTIWVNRGMKIEDGMGMPDRVIGSGFFIDQQGYLLTNHHVIASEVDPRYEGYSRLYIRMPQSRGEKIPARVVGFDPNLDIALLKAEITPETVFPLDYETQFTPGDEIYALGSPGGLESTLTKGIVSAVNRRYLPMGDAIQVDVPINPGNSGGPLVNPQGKLVGVVFAGIEMYEGINFSIPYHWVAQALPRMYADGPVEYTWLGLSLQETMAGLSISYIFPESPADSTGLKQEDVLTAINGRAVYSISEAQRIMMEQKPGTLISLTYTRGGESHTIPVEGTLRETQLGLKAVEADSRGNLLSPFFGIMATPTGGGWLGKTFLIDKVYPGTVGDELGLSKNDPISISDWRVLEEEQVLVVSLVLKKRKAGFVESAMQLAAYLELNNLI